MRRALWHITVSRGQEKAGATYSCPGFYQVFAKKNLWQVLR